MRLTPRQAVAMVESEMKEKRMIFEAISRLLGGKPPEEGTTPPANDGAAFPVLPRNPAQIAQRIAEVRALGTVDKVN